MAPNDVQVTVISALSVSRLLPLMAIILVVIGCESSSTAPEGGSAVAAAPSRSGQAGPRPGAQPLTSAGQMQPQPGDRCPVCAMPVDQHRKLVAALELTDGRTYYFCGTGCLLRTWLHPEQLLRVPREQLSRAVVREHFTGRPLDARSVVWIAGSDVVGPMGPAFVPLADEAAAATFRRRHGGQHTFSLDELTDELWLTMTGKKAGR